MTKHNSGEMRSVETARNLAAVAQRLELMFHSLVAMHDLCDEMISGSSVKAETVYVVLRDMLRLAARDSENCAEILAGNQGGLGFYETNFGKI